MSQTVEPATCAECGFSVESREHLGGIGLHGHKSTSVAEANAQRHDVMRRAQAFADKVAAAQEAAEKAASAVLTPIKTSTSVATPPAPPTAPRRRSARKASGRGKK